MSQPDSSNYARRRAHLGEAKAESVGDPANNEPARRGVRSSPLPVCEAHAFATSGENYLQRLPAQAELPTGL